MSVYKTCSIDRVIGRIYRDFKPSNSGWVDDAIEWVGEAIDIMKVHQGYGEQHISVNVVDYRFKLPCGIENLLAVTYGNKRLQRSGGINHKNTAKCTASNLMLNVQESYSLNPNYGHTTFKEGCVTVYYEGIELDCNGFPTVIDDAVYIEALTWYVMARMLLRGFKHQTITYEFADMKWEKTYPKAQNRFRMCDIDEQEVFKKSWVGAVKNTNLANELFNTVVAGYGINSPSFNPGDRVESFPILGTNLNNS